jgi:hypothetical protein
MMEQISMSNFWFSILIGWIMGEVLIWGLNNLKDSERK